MSNEGTLCEWSLRSIGLLRIIRFMVMWSSGHVVKWSCGQVAMSSIEILFLSIDSNPVDDVKIMI